MNNLEGNRFGRLIAVELAGYRRYSPKTKKLLWKCVCDCGNTSIVPATCLMTGKSRSCGCLKLELQKSRLREKGSNWKGGRQQTEHGYMLIYDPLHPASRSNGYVSEHRVIMESMIGRCLYNDETVHHINGIKSDNRIENLELWSKRHPSGQRVSDLVKWAKEILERYGSD